ncbi:MAG: hypothetical protein V2A56_07635 [bacterium]
MNVVWIFLDGVGLGVDDPEVNPWASVIDPTLIAVANRGPSWPGAVMKPLDATLGITGLPQSATGTTAMLTGINAPQKIGRHLSGFPTPALQAIIHEHSVHKQAIERGLKPTFANAYNEAYFKRPKRRESVTTHAVHAAERLGMRFRMMDDYRNGLAVFHDLTGELIRIQGNGDRLTAPANKQVVFKRFVRDPKAFREMVAQWEIEVIDPVEAGHRIARLAPEHDLVLFEYVKTDMMGHDCDPGWATDVVNEVMLFLRALLDDLDTSRDTLLISSDHGNSEDITVKTHTLNPVPAVALGPLAHQILDRCNSILDITPALLDTLDNHRKQGQSLNTGN